MAAAGLIQAIAWPITAVAIAMLFRNQIRNILEVLTHNLTNAKTIKAAGIEIEMAREEINEVTARAAEAGRKGIENGKIPEEEIRVASEAGKRLQEGELPASVVTRAAREKLLSLAQEYDRTRSEMPASSERTVRMNEIAAQMRVLSVSCRPMLGLLMTGQSEGRRLAAICILQVVPELGFFHWLIERIFNENQAFLLYQSSIAILNIVRNVRTHMYVDREKTRRDIQGAIDHVKGFKGGAPDRNTIAVLEEALEEIERIGQHN